MYRWPKILQNVWLLVPILRFQCYPSPLFDGWLFDLPRFLKCKAEKIWKNCLNVKTPAMGMLSSSSSPSPSSSLASSSSFTVASSTPWDVAIRQLKHFVAVMCLFVLLGIIKTFLFEEGSNQHWENFHPVKEYGLLLCVVLYSLQHLVLISLPFFFFNFLGVVFINSFSPRPKLHRSPLLGPFLCFRVVTRGLFPKLVNENVRHNLQICNKVGLQNYIIEVVTDVPVNLENVHRSRELVVPREYKTKTGSLFKARALQYALEPEVDILSPGDWIVHLDEETILTEESVIGVMNFAVSGEHPFGQGVITYGCGQIVNWITTLADSIRVGIDYGCLRFCLGILHKPVFSWKGSFIVADAEAEKQVSFDHGLEGSLAEDCFFACVAYSRGYSFGTVDGVMHEKSTFTLVDFIHQRRRWMQGIFQTALSKNIPFRYKVGPILMTLAACALPFNLLALILGFIWPLPPSPSMSNVYTFVIGVVIYLFLLGTVRTFSPGQHGLLKCSIALPATLVCGLIGGVLENISSILVFWPPRTSNGRHGFYVVNKQIARKDCLTKLL